MESDVSVVTHEAFKRADTPLWYWLSVVLWKTRGLEVEVIRDKKIAHINCVYNTSRSSTPHPCCSLQQLIFSLSSCCLQTLLVLESTLLCRKKLTVAVISLASCMIVLKTLRLDRAFPVKRIFAFLQLMFPRLTLNSNIIETYKQFFHQQWKFISLLSH